MGLKNAAIFAIVALFALIYAIVFVIGIWFLPAGFLGLFIMVGLTIGIVFLQYAVSPYIIQWLYRIHWMSFDEFSSRYPHLARVVNKVCDINGIKKPRMGFIHDLNPNAFTFGHTKNNARVVITDGILKHLNKKEQEAVVAHEMGHVVHSDFILMTIVFAIPLVLLTIARWAYYTARFGGRGSRDEGGSIQAAFWAIAVLSYIAYYIGFLISLVISRIREYFADEHASEVLEDPNALSTALIKIAYGLVADAGRVSERNRSRVRGLKGMGIFDPKAAKSLAVSSVGSSGKFSKEAIQATAAWDLFNPWAKYYQLFSTHPLPAKRIIALNKQCEKYGKKPEIDFSKAKEIKEKQAGKSMLDEFLYDLTIKLLPLIIFIAMIAITIIYIFSLAGIIGMTVSAQFTLNLLLIWALGIILIGIGAILKSRFKYKKGHEPKKIVELLTQIKVSPIRCIPAIIEGRVIGRGIAGFFFSEDLYVQDNTGMIHVDYDSGIPFGNFFFAIARAKKLVGQRVRVEGWYRRGPGPYFQVSRIYAESGKRFRNFRKQIAFFFAFLLVFIGILLLILYFYIQGLIVFTNI
ncbi:MAG: zinc metalloprotease HtpX [Promethearchaeota archaeon]